MDDDDKREEKEMITLNPNDIRHSSSKIEKELLGEERDENINDLQPHLPPPPNSVIYFPYTEKNWSIVVFYEVFLLVILYFCCLSIYNYPFFSFIFIIAILLLNKYNYFNDFNQLKRSKPEGEVISSW